MGEGLKRARATARASRTDPIGELLERQEINAALQHAKTGWPTVAKPSCDYDTGTAFIGPRKCGKPAKFIWDDTMAGRERLVCGIHARSARSKFHDTVRPIDGKEN